jgi:hypothetical protein
MMELRAAGRPILPFCIHLTVCQIVGYAQDDYTINRFTDDARPFGGGVGAEYDSFSAGGNVPVYECVEGCPARTLDEQSGNRKGSHNPKPSAAPGGNTWGGTFQTNRGPRGYDDQGGASRYFHQSTWQHEVYEQLQNADKVGYFSKSSPTERNAGLSHMEKHFLATMGDGIGEREHNDQEEAAWVNNPHPTLKAIDLTRWLATLLLPPDIYSPRRLLVPFSGVSSEIIGAMYAGWDEIVGIELKEDYAEIGRERVKFWERERERRPHFTVRDVLETSGKKVKPQPKSQMALDLD